MKPSDLTQDEQLLYMPKWRKILIGIFVVIMPIIGSVESVSFL